MGEPMSSKLAPMIRDGAAAGEIAAHLDALDDGPRVEEIYQLGMSEQKKLWELAASNAPISVEQFAPAADQKIIYRGRNSLIAFSRFEKHFWRPSDGGLAFGYNENPGIVEWFAGPGYFSFFAENGLIVFDYTKAPSQQLPDWPKIEINEKGFGPRVVYGYMQDYNRRVSERVVIGHAHKKGKPIPAYYTVTRVDRRPH
jgi:hypothetical protein